MIRIKNAARMSGEVVTLCGRVLERDSFDPTALVVLTRALTMTDDRMDTSDAASGEIRVDGSRETYLASLLAMLVDSSVQDATYLCRNAKKKFPRDIAFMRIRRSK